MAIGQHVEKALQEQANPKPKYGANDVVTINVPRWVAQDIATQARSPKITPAAVTNDRTITIKGKDRQALEALVQTTIESPEQLINFVRRLCAVKINGVERTFTASELARFQMQAEFHGRTTDVFMKEMMDEIVGRMLEQI